MTIKIIIDFATTIVTYIMGLFAKKFNWIEKEYIPLQNMLIGLLVGVLMYIFQLNDNVGISILSSEIFAMGAGGIYDLAQTHRTNEGSEKND